MTRNRALSASVLLLLVLPFTAWFAWGAPASMFAAVDDGVAFSPFQFGTGCEYQDPEGGVLMLAVEQATRTRDGFGRDQDAVLVTESWPGTTEQIERAIDGTTGTQLWRQATADAEDEGPWTWRTFDLFATPWAFGASVLAGNAFETGDTLFLPLWDGPAEPVLRLEIVGQRQAYGRSLWAVGVDVQGVAGLRPSGWTATGAVPGSTILVDPETACPIAVLSPDGVALYVLTAYQPGSGVAWLAQAQASAPWTTRPGLRMESLADPFGPPPEDADGPTYGDLTLREAVMFAESSAPGLAQFRNTQGVIALTLATSYDGGRVETGAAGIVAVARSSVGWGLLYQAPNESVGWQVDVELESTRVLGVDVDRHLRVVEERPQEWFEHAAVPIEDPIADFAQNAAGFWPAQGADTLQSWGVMRSQEVWSWTSRARFDYLAGYYDESAACTGVCHFRVRTIEVDSSTGSVSEVQGPMDFIEAVDSSWVGPSWPGA